LYVLLTNTFKMLL